MNLDRRARRRPGGCKATLVRAATLFKKPRSTQRLRRRQRRNTQGFFSVLCELPPPLGVVLPELRRGSPTSLRQGYRGPPKLQRRRKRLRREGGCGQTSHSLLPPGGHGS